LLSIHGLTIEVERLDAIAGTPVLDIKPYIAGFAPKRAVRQPGWNKGT
jgi:tRNA (Thr-GGU) A37 N-methylase